MREVEKSGTGVLSPICHKKQSSSSDNTTARGSGKQFFRKLITGFLDLEELTHQLLSTYAFLTTASTGRPLNLCPISPVRFIRERKEVQLSC